VIGDDFTLFPKDISFIESEILIIS